LFRNDLTYFGLLNQKFFKGIFTTLGTKGRNGPTAIGDHYNDQDHYDYVELKNGRQMFTVPRSGLYKIKVTGASGGDSTENVNIHQGYGAVVTCNVFLEEGTLLAIVVGQEGELARGTSNRAGGGGGGSYVCIDNNGSFVPLVIAGGGNGCSWGGFQKNGVCCLLGKKREMEQEEERAEEEVVAVGLKIMEPTTEVTLEVQVSSTAALEAQGPMLKADSEAAVDRCTKGEAEVAIVGEML